MRPALSSSVSTWSACGAQWPSLQRGAARNPRRTGCDSCRPAVSTPPTRRLHAAGCAWSRITPPLNGSSCISRKAALINAFAVSFGNPPQLLLRGSGDERGPVHSRRLHAAGRAWSRTRSPLNGSSCISRKAASTRSRSLSGILRNCSCAGPATSRVQFIKNFV